MLPVGTEGLAGVTAIEDSTGAVTVNWAVPLIEFCVAVIVTGAPTVIPVASPVLLMVAMLVFEDDQDANVVKS